MIYFNVAVVLLHLFPNSLGRDLLSESIIEHMVVQTQTIAQAYTTPINNYYFQGGVNANTAQFYGSYDYIIVGIGVAGSVLVERLSQNRNVTILAVEAGAEARLPTIIPALWGYHQFDESLNWGYFSTPQKNACQGMNNQQCPVPRGKAPGGSSQINAMMYVRGNQQDYDLWAEETDNSRWAYNNVLPFFKKSENTECNGRNFYHGKGGLWNNEYSQPISFLHDYFVNASRKVDLKEIPDYNGATQIGISQLQYNFLFGRRHSLAKAFLNYGRKRSNVKVLTRTLATEVLLDSNNTAYGVKFVTADSKFYANATRKVILSAGAINTPQLLMLSGIGPKDELENLGIETKVDLPVGKNLSDHAMYTGFVVRTNNTFISPPLTEQANLFLQGLGPLTTVANVFSVFFKQLANSSLEKGRPDIETLLPFPGTNPIEIAKLLNYNATVITMFSSQINSLTDIPFYLINLHPIARGTVSLKSSDPTDFPLIDFNMLGEQKDIDVLIDGIMFLEKFVKTPAMQKLGARVLNPRVCDLYKLDSSAYYECLVKTFTATVYHPCGTCIMGTDSKYAVVDDDLNVYNTQNLMVVDASVFPVTFSGHLSSITVMLAEVASDLIKQGI